MATILTDDRTKFDQAIRLADRMISSTYGAHGMNVSSAGFGDRQTFDDGLKAIALMAPEDPMEMEAFYRVRDAAFAQHKKGGDGTSTTMLLTCRLYLAGMELVKQGIPPRQVVDGMKEILDRVTQELQDTALKPTIKGVFQAVAKIAMHGDEKLGDLIGGLVFDLGPTAIVTAEPSSQKEISVSKSSGYTWKRGVPDVGFYNFPSRMEHEDPWIVIVKAELGDIKATFFRRLFEQWAERSEQKTRPLIVICSAVSGSVPGTFLDNAKRGKPMALVSVPGEIMDGDKFMQDLASVTGATVIDDLRGNLLDNFTWAWVGEGKKIVSTLRETTVQLVEKIGGTDMTQHLIDVQGHIEAIYSTEEMLHDDEAQDQKKRRIAALNGAVGIIRVPVISETQINELREVVEDGFQAARAAYSGVLPGGGAALRYVSVDLSEGPRETAIETAVRKVLESLFATQCENAGLDPDPIVDMLLESDGNAYNFATNEGGNCVTIGAIDPLDVVTGALRNAASVALPLINTKYFVANVPENNP